MIATPGWLKWPSYDELVSCENSPPPYEFEITLAPSEAAVSSAAARLANEFESASTSTILQFVWQTAWAISTSSEISSAQPASFRG